MSRLNREQIPLVISLVLAAVSLGLYLGVSWKPVIRSQFLLAPKIHRPVAVGFTLHWTASSLALPPAALLLYSP